MEVMEVGVTRDARPTLPLLAYRKQVSEEVGVGLFAGQDLSVGEVVLVEDPLVFIPDSHDDPNSCIFCSSNLLGAASSPVASGSKRKRVQDVNESCCCLNRGCRAQFCSKDCRQEAYDRFHAVECLFGPQGRQFEKFLTAVKSSGWHSCHAVARLLLHCILAIEREEATGLALLGRYLGIARTSIAIATEKRVGRAVFERDVLPTLTKLFRLFKEAFERPRRLRWPAVLQSQLTLSAWLDWIGAWGMNAQEQGLYAIQSALNHSCAPNVRVEHRSDAARITVVAIRYAKPHEQLFHCYLDPDLARMDVSARREHLWTFYHFHCDCSRCSQELLETTATTVTTSSTPTSMVSATLSVASSDKAESS
jgi:hypothetical protein